MWLAERILATKLENQNLTVKLLKINFKHQLNQFAISMDANLYTKNQHHSSIQSWHLIEDLILAFSSLFSGMHSIQGWKATTKHVATRKRKRKRSKAKKDLDVLGKLRMYNQVCLNTLIWMDSIIHTDV